MLGTVPVLVPEASADDVEYIFGDGRTYLTFNMDFHYDFPSHRRTFVWVGAGGALIVDKSVEASHIKVEADDETHTVILKGSVPSVAERAAAEAIARRKAKGYRIKNLLKVAATGPERG